MGACREKMTNDKRRHGTTKGKERGVSMAASGRFNRIKQYDLDLVRLHCPVPQEEGGGREERYGTERHIFYKRQMPTYLRCRCSDFPLASISLQRWMAVMTGAT